MAIATNLHALVDEFAALLESLSLDGDDQEEYSTVLSWLETQAERDESNETIVRECLEYLTRETWRV